MSDAPTLSRRSLLVGGAVGLTALATLGPAGAASAAMPVPPKGLEWQTIGPRSCASHTDLYYRPRDANYVPWKWARATGMTIQDAVATLGPNDILVLPEDSRPYEIDSSKGFNGKGSYRGMVRVPRGIVGLGPGAVVAPSNSGFTAPRASDLQEKLIECVAPKAYFANFTLRGRDFGDAAYHGIYMTGDDSIVERMRFQGAHRGYDKVWPYEAGAISFYRGARPQVRNTEIDGYSPESGRSLGTSPIMFNRNVDSIVTDVYAHRTSIGMPTWWECTNAQVERLVHEDVSYGPGNCPGVNIEDSSGTFRFLDTTFNIGYLSPRNRGLHLNVGGARGFKGTIDMRNTRMDSGPAGAGRLAIQHWGAQRREDVTYVIRTAAGAAAPYDVYA